MDGMPDPTRFSRDHLALSSYTSSMIINNQEVHIARNIVQTIIESITGKTYDIQIISRYLELM